METRRSRTFDKRFTCHCVDSLGRSESSDSRAERHCRDSWLPSNGFNHKCNWWINIVTWRGMAKWNAQIICFVFPRFLLLRHRLWTLLWQLFVIKLRFMHTHFIFSWRFSLFNQWRELIFIFYGKKEFMNTFVSFFLRKQIWAQIFAPDSFRVVFAGDCGGMCPCRPIFEQLFLCLRSREALRTCTDCDWMGFLIAFSFLGAIKQECAFEALCRVSSSPPEVLTHKPQCFLRLCCPRLGKVFWRVIHSPPEIYDRQNEAGGPEKRRPIKKTFLSLTISLEREVNIKERNRAQNVFVPLTVYT